MASATAQGVLAQQSDDPFPDQSDNDGSSGDQMPTFSGGAGSDGAIGAGVDVGDSSSGGGGSGGGEAAVGAASYEQRCQWAPANIRNTAGTGASDPSAPAGAQIENAAGQLGWLRRCGAGATDFVWLAPAIDPIDLVPSASARARAQLPLPTPVMNPPADVGSVVNLGVWFAIDDPGTTTARATLGSAWAQVRGTFQSVSVDPGDGSGPVTCDGFGTPYPEGSNDPDQGPCGHTYLERTPDGQPHQMTYTITYALDWSTSDGRSGSLGTYDRSITFGYDIDEIQIVGTGR